MICVAEDDTGGRVLLQMLRHALTEPAFDGMKTGVSHHGVRQGHGGHSGIAAYGMDLEFKRHLDDW